LICYSFFVPSIFFIFSSSLTLPIPPKWRDREKDKKRKHARNANNGQLTRPDERTTFFQFSSLHKLRTRQLILKKIQGNTLAYLVTKKTGSPVKVDLQEDTLLLEKRHKIHFLSELGRSPQECVEWHKESEQRSSMAFQTDSIKSCQACNSSFSH
jgi:hypothetical protein